MLALQRQCDASLLIYGGTPSDILSQKTLLGPSPVLLAKESRGNFNHLHVWQASILWKATMEQMLDPVSDFGRLNS